MEKKEAMKDKTCIRISQPVIKLRGSFTVEATVIVGLICMITGMMILLGMYCHDRVVMRQAADQAAVDAAMWCGNYVVPAMKEVDYEKLKQMAVVDVSEGISGIETYLNETLLIGKMAEISLSKTMAGQQVTARVTVDFNFAGRNFSVTEEGRSAVFGSMRFKRKSVKQENQHFSQDQ